MDWKGEKDGQRYCGTCRYEKRRKRSACCDDCNHSNLVLLSDNNFLFLVFLVYMPLSLVAISNLKSETQSCIGAAVLNNWLSFASCLAFITSYTLRFLSNITWYLSFPVYREDDQRSHSNTMGTCRCQFSKEPTKIYCA